MSEGYIEERERLLDRHKNNNYMYILYFYSVFSWGSYLSKVAHAHTYMTSQAESFLVHTPSYMYINF